MTLLSIIIPVYNVEEYLSTCIDSTLYYKENNIEILLIDDGSTDNSGSICDSYEKKDKRIRVYHKENGGLSDARNYGIAQAKGKYILFLDSDDYIKQNSIISVMNMLIGEECDVIMSPYNEYIDKRFKAISGTNDAIDELVSYNKDEELIINLFRKTKLLWSAWKFIVKRELLIQNNISFKKGYLHEDVDYTTRILLKMNTFKYYNNPWYCYRLERAGSIMNNKGFKSLNDTTDIIIDLKEYMHKEKISEKVQDVVLDKLSRTLYTTINLYKLGDNTEKDKLINKFKSNKYLLSKSTNKKHKLFYCLSNIIGIKNLFFIVSRI